MSDADSEVFEANPAPCPPSMSFAGRETLGLECCLMTKLPGADD